jgi:hypothetical protein
LRATYQPTSTSNEADVRVGEEPRVGRIAGTLEAVPLEAGDRIDVAELVGEQDPAATASDSGELGDDELRTADVVEDPQTAHEVEVAVGERERLRVADDEAAAGRRVLASRFEVLLGRVDAHHVADQWGERVRERAGAASHVERPFVARDRGEQPPKASLELGLALGLERTAVLDPVRRRAPPSWSAPARR